jgi:hypothetical protein
VEASGDSGGFTQVRLLVWVLVLKLLGLGLKPFSNFRWVGSGLFMDVFSFQQMLWNRL